MVSLQHEELVELFRHDPLLAVEMLQRSGALALPIFTRAEIRPGELREMLPTERRVDVVVLLANEDPVYVLLVEVQTSIDPKKKLTWPYYLVALRVEYGCNVALLVCSPSPEVRTWASAPIPTGHPDFVLKPVVLGPGEVPRVEDETEARKAPYRAILSALMHADEPGAEKVMVAAFRGSDMLPEEERDLWRELMALALQNNEVARRALEAIMNVQQWRDKSVWFKQGKVEEARKAVEHVLSRRGLLTTGEQQTKLAACDDLAQLERWLDQAITATSADEALR